MYDAGVEDLSTEALTALVERTFAFYAEQGVGFERKTYDHERADLRPLLVARGAVPQDREVLVLGETAAPATEVALPEGLTLRQVSELADLRRVAAKESEVSDDDWSWLGDDLAGRIHGGEPTEVFIVEDGDRVVSAAWLVPLAGTRVAGLRGGSTLKAYRGRGI
jgi:hypothetical protein